VIRRIGIAVGIESTGRLYAARQTAATWSDIVSDNSYVALGNKKAAMQLDATIIISSINALEHGKSLSLVCTGEKNVADTCDLSPSTSTLVWTRYRPTYIGPT